VLTTRGDNKIVDYLRIRSAELTFTLVAERVRLARADVI